MSDRTQIINRKRKDAPLRGLQFTPYSVTGRSSGGVKKRRISGRIHEALVHELRATAAVAEESQTLWLDECRRFRSLLPLVIAAPLELPLLLLPFPLPFPGTTVDTFG